MIKVDEIIEALKASELILAKELLSKIETEGWQLERGFAGSPTPCGELYTTYSIRNKGLEKRRSAHATQLHKSTAEFIENLKIHKDLSCYLNNFVGNEEHEYLFSLEPTKKKILGVMRTYSQLKVSANRWQEIWSAP